MTREFKRMIQRRGLRKDLPTNPQEGEINITTDTEEFIFGVNNKYIKLLGENSFVDTLENPSPKVPASVHQLATVNVELINLKNYVLELEERLNEKQDLLAHKGTTPPSDKGFLWIDTN